jgi:hypothetical protein
MFSDRVAAWLSERANTFFAEPPSTADAAAPAGPLAPGATSPGPQGLTVLSDRG